MWNIANLGNEVRWGLDEVRTPSPWMGRAGGTLQSAGSPHGADSAEPERCSAPVGPLWHDNMIYGLYKYPSGRGNNALDDIFQAALGLLVRCSPGIIGNGKKTQSADPYAVLQVTSKSLCADPCSQDMAERGGSPSCFPCMLQSPGWNPTPLEAHIPQNHSHAA